MENKSAVSTPRGNEGGIPIQALGDAGEVYYELALAMLDEIEANNAAGRPTVLICPVGPVGQYAIFTRLVNARGLPLKSCWFINMDEYLTNGDEWIDESSPHSFRGFMRRQVYGAIAPHLLPPPEQRLFPDPKNCGQIPALIERLGGVDLCVGGMGINGHLAFNEPDCTMDVHAFSGLSTHVGTIAPETRTTFTIDNTGASLDEAPVRCVTVGMREILGARKVRLGCFRNWHRGILRRAAFGPVSPACPASLLQAHPNALILASANAAL